MGINGKDKKAPRGSSMIVRQPNQSATGKRAPRSMSVRLPAELWAYVENVAVTERRSLNNAIVRIIERDPERPRKTA